ncbi:MAG: ABC transporter substrate-binding protein [Stellaceae bacterium]
MRRRELLLAAATAGAWKPAPAAVEIPRIGFVQAGLRQDNQSLLDAFRDRLSELGWSDGGNIEILDRWADERTERLPGIITELIAAGAKMLVTVGTPVTLAAKRATATVPIVFVGVDNPVALGIVESVAQPRGNATGLSISSSELIMTRLQLLQELLPNLRRLAVIVRRDPGLEQKLRDIRNKAASMGIEPVIFEAPTGIGLRLAFMRLHGDSCEAVYVASGPLGPAKRAQLIALAAEARLPAIYSFRVFPLDGGLMSFGADYGDLLRRAAGLAVEILKGAKPARLPVEPPTKFQLVINLKTAKALALAIPAPLLARADEVIE